MCGDAVRVMDGSCVGYDTCYTAECDSGFVGDVTGSCGGKAKACGYDAGCGGSFGNVYGLYVTF